VAEERARVEILCAPLEEEREVDWLQSALDGEARAVLWHGVQGLVVPASYRRFPNLDAVRERFVRDGWPVRVRRSGGRPVPQGPGILNLSLTRPLGGSAGVAFGAVYDDLCVTLAAALARLGVATRQAEVPGSFCDGRHNLAVGARKIAGTAQYWIRRGGRQAVLAHALLLVDVDTEVITARLNELETTLGSGRRYLAGAVTTLARELPSTGAEEIFDLVRRHLADVLAQR